MTPAVSEQGTGLANQVGDVGRCGLRELHACVERSAQWLARRHPSGVSTSSAARSEEGYDAGVP